MHCKIYFHWTRSINSFVKYKRNTGLLNYRIITTQLYTCRSEKMTPMIPSAKQPAKTSMPGAHAYPHFVPIRHAALMSPKTGLPLQIVAVVKVILEWFVCLTAHFLPMPSLLNPRSGLGWSCGQVWTWHEAACEVVDTAQRLPIHAHPRVDWTSKHLWKPIERLNRGMYSPLGLSGIDSAKRIVQKIYLELSRARGELNL